MQLGGLEEANGGALPGELLDRRAVEDEIEHLRNTRQVAPVSILKLSSDSDNSMKQASVESKKRSKERAAEQTITIVHEKESASDLDANSRGSNSHERASSGS